MANISLAVGYVTFEADTCEVVEHLMEAVKPMSEGFNYFTDFKWEEDFWPNSEGTRVRVGFVGLGRSEYCENVKWVPDIVAGEKIPELERERWSMLWDFSDVESYADFCGNYKILIEHPAGVLVSQSTWKYVNEETYSLADEGRSLLRYPRPR